MFGKTIQCEKLPLLRFAKKARYCGLLAKLANPLRALRWSGSNRSYTIHATLFAETNFSGYNAVIVLVRNLFYESFCRILTGQFGVYSQTICSRDRRFTFGSKTFVGQFDGIQKVAARIRTPDRVELALYDAYRKAEIRKIVG